MVNVRNLSSSSATKKVAADGGARPKTLRMDNDSHVKVAVRCRPMSDKETKDGHQSIVEFEAGQRVVVKNVGESPSDQLGTRSGDRSNLSQVYEFDAVFDWNCSQEQVYNTVCRPIVDSVLDGYNGTIFAYGQTGTGKTYTMEGPGVRLSSRRRASELGKRNSSAESPRGEAASARSVSVPLERCNESRGVIPRAFEHIFHRVADLKEVQFLVRASYMEIYQEEIHDLLRKKSRSRQPQQQQQQPQGLKLQERANSGVYVRDLTSYVCKSMEDIERVMRVGNQNRKVGATDMNEHSSRSHAIFTITIEQQLKQSQPESEPEVINVKPSLQSAAVAARNKQQQQLAIGFTSNSIKVGRLNLVDLAGSERQRKTNNSGQRHKESIKINLSLSALGNVINSLMKMNGQRRQQSSKSATLATGKGNTTSESFHVPYRDSKLTRLLQDSLGGNSRTLMIANIGPASYNYDETINTLNYASRAKCIENRPRLNEDPKDTLLRQLQHQIKEMRLRLASLSTTARSNANATTQTGGSRMSQNDADLVELELAELRKKLASLESKLLNGEPSENGAINLELGDRVNRRLLEILTQKQASQLEENKAHLMEQADRQRAIRDQLERRQEAELEVQRTYSSVQQEVAAKRALVRQVLLRTKGLRDQLEGSQNSLRLELDELDQLQYVLQKELRLKCLIMDNFIPNHHVNELLTRIVYDERRDLCFVDPIELALDTCSLGSSSLVHHSDIWQAEMGAHQTPDRRRAQSELERINETINPNDARYLQEMVLDLRVEEPSFGEPPKRLSEDSGKSRPKGAYGQPLSEIQALVEAALDQHEPDIVI